MRSCSGHVKSREKFIERLAHPSLALQNSCCVNTHANMLTDQDGPPHLVPNFRYDITPWKLNAQRGSIAELTKPKPSPI